MEGKLYFWAKYFEFLSLLELFSDMFVGKVPFKVDAPIGSITNRCLGT